MDTADKEKFIDTFVKSPELKTLLYDYLQACMYSKGDVLQEQKSLMSYIRIVFMDFSVKYISEKY